MTTETVLDQSLTALGVRFPARGHLEPALGGEAQRAGNILGIGRPNHGPGAPGHHAAEITAAMERLTGTGGADDTTNM